MLSETRERGIFGNAGRGKALLLVNGFGGTPLIEYKAAGDEGVGGDRELRRDLAS
jgi:hypothetical protein